MNKAIVFILLLMLASSVGAAEFARFSDDGTVTIRDKIKVSLLGSSAGARKSEGKGFANYANILDYTDARYTVYPGKLKEEIILKAKPGFSKLRFRINLSDGDYYFDSSTNELFIYHSRDIHIVKGIFYAPYFSYNGTDHPLAVRFKNSIYEIDISPILSLSDNAFPLVIDPTYGDVSGCSENATHVICSGTISGTYINTDKSVVFNHTSWFRDPGCAGSSIAITTTKDFQVYGHSSVTASCSGCSPYGSENYCGSVSINANNSFASDFTVSNGCCGGTHGYGNPGASGSVTWTNEYYVNFNNVDISSFGYMGRGMNYCGFYFGGSATTTLYGKYVRMINGSSLSAQGGGCGYSPCDGGDATCQIIQKNGFGGSYLDYANGTIMSSTSAGIGCSSTHSTDAIANFETVMTDETTFSASADLYSYFTFTNGNRFIFFNRTTFAASNLNPSTGRNITLNGTDASIALFDPSVTGSLKMSVASLNDNNLTVGYLEPGDVIENFTISGIYHSVYYPAFFDPDYRNISLSYGSLNYTSEGGNICGYNGSAYIECHADYEQPNITFRTYNPAVCKFWNSSKNWTLLDSESVPDCEYSDGITYMDGGRSHTCTFPSALYDGLHTLYLACKSYDYETSPANQPANVLNATIDKRLTAYDAISRGVLDILPQARLYNNRIVYVRTKSGQQSYAPFDAVAEYGNKRWAFNYVSLSDNPIPTFYNLSDVFHFHQMRNITTSDIAGQVSSLVNSTK